MTGGAGFIGSHTVDALVAAGHAVRVLDSLAPPVHQADRPPQLRAGTELLRGDVRDRAVWERALADVDAVFHLAAYQDYLPDFSRFFHVNAVGTALLYEVVVDQQLDLAKVVVASSQSVYGEGPYTCRQPGCAIAGELRLPPIRAEAQLVQSKWDHRCPGCGEPLTPLAAGEDLANPQNQYALSKHAEERIALTLGRSYGIPSVALRYSIVQGPRQSFTNTYSGACRIFCLSQHFGVPIVVYEDGHQQRDYVNIHDAVAANLLVLDSPAADGQVLNVGGGRAYTVLEFAGIVAEHVDRPVEVSIPGRYRYGDTRHIVSDTTRLQMLGWRPEHTPRDSVREYAEWLHEQGDAVTNSLDDAWRTMTASGVIRSSKA